MPTLYLEICDYANGTEPKDMESATRDAGCGKGTNAGVDWVDGQIGGDFTPLGTVQGSAFQAARVSPGFIGGTGDVALGDARFSFKITRGSSSTSGNEAETHGFGGRYFGGINLAGILNGVFCQLRSTSSTQVTLSVREISNRVQQALYDEELFAWAQDETKWLGFDIVGTNAELWVSDTNDFLNDRTILGDIDLVVLTAPSAGEGSVLIEAIRALNETGVSLLDDFKVEDIVTGTPLPLGRLDGLLAKVESTPGTFESMSTSTDGVRLAERAWSRIAYDGLFDHLRLGAASGSAIPVNPDAPPCPLLVRVEIVVELRGLGSAYSSSARQETDALLRACGLSATVDNTGGAEKITYVSIDGPSHETVSLELYAGGLKFEITGCRGNFLWPIRAGRIGRGIFNMQGIMNDDPVVSGLPSITYDSTAPLAATSMSMSIGGWSANALVPDSGSFDFGSRVAAVPSGNAETGVAEVAISSRRPSFALRGQSDVGNYEPFAILAAGTTAALNAQLGSTRLNRLTVTESAAQIKPNGIRQVELDGFMGFNLRYHCPNPSLVFD
ncbi:hypothetical protein LCGC14_1673580 [marine sediment metagenome]|uniref:Uncharacterized protein n=1 Tax=marine sediment metagenome TaxID=412755 RepID=A0A0F9HQM0_9ZZZZ